VQISFVTWKADRQRVINDRRLSEATAQGFSRKVHLAADGIKRSMIEDCLKQMHEDSHAKSISQLTGIK
jgi:hypothetical protein